MRLSVICENTVGRPIQALAEHGFACLVETGQGAWLFDTGRGDTLLQNLGRLEIVPRQIDAVLLSHGHNDHVGGLLPLIEEIGPRRVYAHPGIFRERYWQGEHERRDISVPASRKALSAAGCEFVWVDAFMEIAEGLFCSGPIARVTDFEAGDPHLVCRHGSSPVCTPDDFVDDAALGINTARGLVILLGCAHAGLVNTIEHFRKHLGGSRIHAIVGGTHLGPASEAQYKETLGYLDRLDFDRLGVAHCTGQRRAAELYARYPNKVFFASVGTTLEA